jgi:hypothetical protein
LYVKTAAMLWNSFLLPSSESVKWNEDVASYIGLTDGVRCCPKGTDLVNKKGWRVRN